MDSLNLNQRAAKVAQSLASDAAGYGVKVHTIAGATVIDAGVQQTGSLGAGLLTAKVCLADLASLSWSSMALGSTPSAQLPVLNVEVRQPVAACMASQYAGWQINVDSFFAMGSGPMRAAYGHEVLFNHIGLRQHGNDCAVGVLETSRIPTAGVIEHLAQCCGVKTEKLTLIIARTASLAGGVQVVARSVETALHKLHALGFDLSRVKAGFGSAPLPPVAKDDMAAIGRTNDAVLYGGQVTLYVTGDDDSLAKAAQELPSCASKDYGRPFAEIFAACHHDFYKIDPLLFSPAAVCLSNLDTGRSHRAGQVNLDLLAQSFLT